MDAITLAPSLRLNQLSLTEDETAEVISFFSALEPGEAALRALELSETAPMVHVADLTNVLREDVSSQPFTRDELQEGAPEATDGYWQVPRLLE